jgi:hypothetical protein
MSVNPRKALEKALLQVNGMQEYLADATNAPIPASAIQKKSQSVLLTKMRQQNLKAQLRDTTQVLYEHVRELEEDMTRNINYFMGIWGKTDERLEKIGRRAISKTRRRTEETAS